MKAKLPMIARILLGLVFFASGLMGLLNLMPPPADMPEKMLAFTNGMMATGYFFPFLKAVETICGLMLLAGMFVPLALVILAPISIHIFLAHAFMAPPGLPVALVIGALMIYLSFFTPYSPKIKALFQR